MDNALAADLILIAHVIWVGLIVVPVPLIVLGRRRWRWVRNGWIRSLHVAMMLLVALEALFSVNCPLTVWEGRLRSGYERALYAQGFVPHWLSRVLYYDFPPWVFLVGYLAFFLLLAALYVGIPPRWLKAWRERPRKGA